MRKFLVLLIGLSAVVYYLLPELVDGISITDYKAAVIAAVLFSFINIAIKPIIRVISIPFNLLTFGLFGFAINVLLFWFVASVISGFNVVSFVDAIFGSLILIGSNYILDKVVK